MKRLVFGLSVVLMSLVTNAAEAKTVYSCNGYSGEGAEEVEVLVEVVNRGKKLSLEVSVGNESGLAIPVTKKKLAPAELSLYDTYLNEKENVQLDVFLDDVGGMSSLNLRGTEYILTCSSSLEI